MSMADQMIANLRSERDDLKKQLDESYSECATLEAENHRLQSEADESDGLREAIDVFFG